MLPATALDRTGATKIADGSLQTFDSQIDPTTGTIKLRAQFPNDDRLLYPNQFVNIRLLLDTHKDVTTMSAAGIQRGVPGTFVYLVNADSTVSVRPVKLGVTDGDHVEVLSGLRPATASSSTAPTSFATARRSSFVRRTNRRKPPIRLKPRPTRDKSGGGKKRRSEDGQKQ